MYSTVLWHRRLLRKLSFISSWHRCSDLWFRYLRSDRQTRECEDQNERKVDQLRKLLKVLKNSRWGERGSTRENPTRDTKNDQEGAYPDTRWKVEGSSMKASYHSLHCTENNSSAQDYTNGMKIKISCFWGIWKMNVWTVYLVITFPLLLDTYVETLSEPLLLNKRRIPQTLPW